MDRKLPPFHLAIPVRDLAEARAFYGDLLGCPEGRSAERWVDFNLYGHQLVCHFAPEGSGHRSPVHHNPVDGHDVPVPHFGVVLERPAWDSLAARLQAAGVTFLIEPHVRFRGLAGEQATLFFLDPSGNALEFKSFNDIAAGLFAT
jgi:extradiol dioxygenase family protein